MNLQAAQHLLPESMTDIIEVIGFAAAVDLVKALGGRTFAVGRGIEKTARLTMLQDAIGEDAAARLMEIYGGEDLYIPKCETALYHLRNEKFRQEVLELVEAGDSKTMAILKLCGKYNISDRRAWEILKNPPPNRQRPLI